MASWGLMQAGGTDLKENTSLSCLRCIANIPMTTAEEEVASPGQHGQGSQGGGAGAEAPRPLVKEL